MPNQLKDTILPAAGTYVCSITSHGTYGIVAMPLYTHPSGLSIYSWSLDDVSAFLRDIGCEAYVDLFVYHEIDGKALTLLKDYHLLNRLEMKVGPALRIISYVESIRSFEIGSQHLN